MEAALSLEDALELILAWMRPLPAVSVPIADALGTILAEDIVAVDDMPRFSHSAVDGYAVRTVDTVVTPARLRVVGSTPAGSPPASPLGEGQAIRVMAGAPLPDGADAVVPIEDTDGRRDIVTIAAFTDRGQHVRRAAAEARRGESLLSAGAIVRPAEIGLLAAVGRPTVLVIPPPRVAVFATGEELRDVDGSLGPSHIRDSNSYALSAAVRATGAEPWSLGRVGDLVAEIRRALVEASAAQAVVITGGASFGDRDHVGQAIREVGTLHPWSEAIRVGRPVAFGEVPSEDRAVPVFGLPGNPVGALIAFELLVRPALLRLRGAMLLERPRATARVEQPIEKPANVRYFATGLFHPPTGTVHPRPHSHSLRDLALTNCLIDVPAGIDRLDRGTWSQSSVRICRKITNAV